MGKDAEEQLAGFVAKFDPASQKLIRGLRKALRKRLPTANELAYDNYNFLAIGYSPTERTSDAIVSIAAGSNGVSICFIYGARLPDPKNVLLGAGKQTRFVRMASAADLARPEIEALMAEAIARSRAPFRASGRGALVIRSISAKQRPRRKPSRS